MILQAMAELKGDIGKPRASGDDPSEFRHPSVQNL